jgi:kumamolisin
LNPKALAKAYDITPLHDAGIDGTNQTVAVVSFGTFRDSDIAAFDKRFGITGPAIRRVRVGEGEPNSLGTPTEGEVDLDLETIRSIAPKAQILNYESVDSATFAQIFDRIVADGSADIASVSYGWCDDPLEFDQYGDDRAADQASMKAAAGLGITLYIASGDAGAYPCQRHDLTNHVLKGDWPDGSPFAVSVGGTLLSLRRDGSYLEEAGWEGILSNEGGGGGLNPIDAQPAWQDAPGVKNDSSNGKRQFPDVSGPADPASGIFTVSSSHTAGEFGTGGGTSQAAPFFAGVMTLVRQFAAKQGVGKVGFAAPIFYALAREKQDQRPFHDIVRGGNRHYNATPGWDYATGLGTPDANNLAHAVVAYLKKHPTRTPR